MGTASRACPVCASREPQRVVCRAHLLAGVDHDVVECPSCGAAFFDPWPADDELEAFYGADYFRDFDRAKLEGRGRAYARRLARWTTPGRFLDVGCAAGFFINGVRSVPGWDVYGVDLSASALRYAADVLTIEPFRLGRSLADWPPSFFDFVHVNNVVEHVTDPVGLMRECRRIIRDTGLLQLSVPNGANDRRNLIRYFREEGAAGRSKDGHILFLSNRALAALFDASGFEVVSRRTYGFNRGLRNAGLWPHKARWKDPYRPQAPPPAPSAGVPQPREGRRRPDLYHRFRLFRSTLGLPGLHAFGLDYLFLLKPR